MSMFLCFHAVRLEITCNATYRALWRVMTVQGHPRSSTLVPIESPHATSY